MSDQGELPLFDDTEIVIGLVCAIGVNYKQCVHVLDAELKEMGYQTRTVSLSSLMDNLAQSFNLPPVDSSLPELSRIRARMEMATTSVNELSFPASWPLRRYRI